MPSSNLMRTCLWAAAAVLLTAFAPGHAETPQKVVLIQDNAYVVEYSVLKGYFTLRHDNLFPVKGVPVTCTLTAHSGTVLGYLTRTVYEVIPAHGSIKSKGFVLGLELPQTYGVECAAGWADRAT
jgi:hypothetical protein